MIVTATPVVGRGLALERLTDELDRRGLRYATLRQTSVEATLLVTPEHLASFEEAAEHVGLRRTDARSPRCGSTWIAEGAEVEDVGRITAVANLTYGRRLPWLRTGEPERRILRRAGRESGACVVAAPDQLVDALLHGIVDLGAFPAEHRARVRALVDGLRADPVSAGRAAERVQQELAPALTWSDVLAHVLNNRWDALTRRRRALCAQAMARSPMGSLGRSLSGFVGARRDARPQGSATDTLGRKQIRGSGLLLSGRGLATVFKFAAELLVVRYLTTAEYGSWTYALSAVVFLKGLAALGLHRAVARFVPLHVERGEREEFVGVLAFVLGTLMVSGLAVALAFHAFPGAVAALVGAGPEQRLDILFIAVFLVPVETIDDLLTNVCAAFGNSRTIFVRRYLLSPGLRLGVACLLVLLEADVRMLAYGYLFSGLLGVAFYAWTIYGVARRRGLLDAPIRTSLRLPVGRVLSYTVPVMAADLCSILMVTTAPLLLGYFGGVSEVALFTVVVPAVALNNVVYQTFGVLFEPAASRMQTKADREGLGALYWRSAAWVAVLSFPAFAVCFAAAAPLTVLLFGERYAASAPILTLLAAGTFFDVSLGFNSAALRVLGKVRWLLGATVLAAALNLAMNLALIPLMGALGAALATCAALVIGALMKQAALRLATGVRLFDLRYAGPYLAIALATAFLGFARYAWTGSALVLVPAAALAALVVLLSARRALSIGDTFPELARVPVLGRLLG